MIDIFIVIERQIGKLEKHTKTVGKRVCDGRGERERQ